jgi:hypothetical protein
MSHGMREALIREQETESIVSHRKRGRHGHAVKDTRAKALSAFQKSQAYNHASLSARFVANTLAAVATAALACCALALIGGAAFFLLPMPAAVAVCAAVIVHIVMSFCRAMRRKQPAKESSK